MRASWTKREEKRREDKTREDKRRVLITVTKRREM